MRKALVCGAGGFIGSHLVKRLKREGYWVRGVDMKYPRFSPTEADDFIVGDLREMVVAREAVDTRFDEVYQLAADMGGAGYIFTGENDADVMHNSSQINLNMLEACRRRNCEMRIEDRTMLGRRAETGDEFERAPGRRRQDDRIVCAECDRLLAEIERADAVVGKLKRPQPRSEPDFAAARRQKGERRIDEGWTKSMRRHARPRGRATRAKGSQGEPWSSLKSPAGNERTSGAIL